MEHGGDLEVLQNMKALVPAGIRNIGSQPADYSLQECSKVFWDIKPVPMLWKKLLLPSAEQNITIPFFDLSVFFLFSL
jgi:hypothetical protein